MRARSAGRGCDDAALPLPSCGMELSVGGGGAEVSADGDIGGSAGDGSGLSVHGGNAGVSAASSEAGSSTECDRPRPQAFSA